MKNDEPIIIDNKTCYNHRSFETESCLSCFNHLCLYDSFVSKKREGLVMIVINTQSGGV